MLVHITGLRMNERHFFQNTTNPITWYQNWLAITVNLLSNRYQLTVNLKNINSQELNHQVLPNLRAPPLSFYVTTFCKWKCPEPIDAQYQDMP